MTTEGLVPALKRVARATAHRNGACPVCGGETVLADRSDAAVVRHGAAVVKAHADGTDRDGHRIRLALAAHPALAGILLAPLPYAAADVGGRLVTAWPYGLPVDPGDPAAAPWEHVAELLARLHTVSLSALADGLPGPLPPMRAPLKVSAAVARMRAADPSHPAARAVHRAHEDLTGATGVPGPTSLCHGDLHLGQLVRDPGHGRWLLIDVDDTGTGDPAWDLARPAAWFASGLLAPEIWYRFLGTYRAAGGPAVPRAGNPWPRLDLPARALTVQTAALAIAKAAEQQRGTDEVEDAVIDACVRIAALRAN